MADQQGPPGDAPRPPGSDAPVGFDLVGAQRIVRTVRWVEQQIRQPLPQRGRYPVGLQRDGCCAMTGSSGIPAMSGTTPGKGTVTLYKFDGTNLTSIGTITAYNNFTSAVGNSKNVILEWVNGYAFVVAEEC